MLNVLRVYKRSTGKEHAGGSRRPHESRRGGPAPRFLAAVCGRLLDRLTAEERAHDPELEGELATTAAEAAAANWVESARAWAKDSEQ